MTEPATDDLGRPCTIYVPPEACTDPMRCRVHRGAYAPAEHQPNHDEGTPMTTSTETTPTFDEWAIVELLGHRRLAGRIREVQIAGAGFLRLDIPDTGDEKTWQPGATQFISPGSVYALHPVDEETARRAAGLWRPEPVARWQLEPPAARPDPDDELDYDGDGPF